MSNTKPRQLAVVRESTAPLRVESGGAVSVGIDDHKASYSVARFRDRRELITT